MATVPIEQSSLFIHGFDSTTGLMLCDYDSLQKDKTNGSLNSLVDFQHRLHDAAMTCVRVFGDGCSTVIDSDVGEGQSTGYVFGTSVLLTGSVLASEIDYQLLLGFIQESEPTRVKYRFDDLHEKWREDTKYESSATKIIEHPCYQEIIETGESMIPFILKGSTLPETITGSMLCEK